MVQKQDKRDAENLILIEETYESSNDTTDIKIPFDPKEINITVEPKTIGQLVSRLEEGEIDLNTEFQRKGNLWPPDVMSRLIESILLRFPLPTFYFDAENDDKWLVVDGLQRLGTLQRFVVEKDPRKKLFLQGLEILKDFEGLSYDELNRTMQRRIQETQVITYIIKPGTPKKVKYNVFKRINTGGLMLNPMEIRHALNQGYAADFLREVSEDHRFKKYVKVQDKRMQDRELILRYVAFSLNSYKKYEKPLSGFLDKAMEQLGEISDLERRELEENLYRALNIMNKLFGKHAYARSVANDKMGTMLNSALFEVWTSQIAKLNDLQQQAICNSQNQLLIIYKRLFESERFETSISRSTSDYSSVEERFSKIENLIQQFL